MSGLYQMTIANECRLVDKLSNNIEQYKSVLAKLYPTKDLDSLLSLPREELLELALSLPAVASATSPSTGRSHSISEIAPGSEGADSLEALEQAPGTVENARGVTALDAQWRAGLSLNSKTGASTTASGESVSWLVGRLSADQRKIVFASAVWRAEGDVDGLDAARLAIKTFVERGVLQSRH